MLNAIKAFSDSYMKNRHCQEVYAKAKIAEPFITRDMVEIASSLGNTMADLEYALKEASHVEWKLENRMNAKYHKSYEQEMDELNDLVRYTQICPHNTLADSARKTIEKLKEKGYEIYKIDNRFVHPHMGTKYRGLHILAFSPSGQKIELQLHSPISFEAKIKGHELYKQISLGRLSEDEKQKALEEVVKIHSSFPNPPGIETIESINKLNRLTPTEYEATLQFPHHCELTNCSSTPFTIEIDGYISDRRGNILSSYAETTNLKEKDTIAVYNDNNGTKLFVSNPERLEEMISDAVSSCDLALLSELETCRDYLNEVSEPDVIEKDEQNMDLEI